MSTYTRLASKFFKCNPSPAQVWNIKTMLAFIPLIPSENPSDEDILAVLVPRPMCASNYPVAA